MARDNFTILVNLEDYFSDNRQRAKIYIDQNYSKISDLEDKISELFGLKRFHLLSDLHFLPPSEDIALLKNGETVSVKPNLCISGSIILSDTFYNKNNTSDKNTISSEQKNIVSKNDENEESIKPQSFNSNENKYKESHEDVKNSKRMKSKKRKYNELKEEKSPPKERSQNKKLKVDEKSNVPNVIDNEYYSKPIPYKARNCKSWSSSPLLKTTNIVKIVKIPIEKIEMDNSRFVYTPDDNLPPLEPIVVERKDTINEQEAGEVSEDFSMNQNICDVEQQNKSINPEDSQQMEYDILKSDLKDCPNELQHNMISSKSENSLDMLEQEESTSIPDISKQINSDLEICPEQSENNIELNHFSAKSVAQTEFLSLPDISQTSRLQNYSGETQPSESLESSDILKQNITSQKCDQDSIELKRSQNFPTDLQQSQISSLLSQQNLNQNNLSTMNEYSLSKKIDWLNLSCRITQLSESDMKKSRSESREWWTRKIRTELFDLKNDSSKTQKNSLHSPSLDEKWDTSQTNGKGEPSWKADGSHNSNAEGEIAIEKDPSCAGCIDFSLKSEEKEIGSPTDNIVEESTVKNETFTDIENFPERRRKRKRRHRKKMKVEAEIPRQEKINTFPSKWVPYIPAKPKIHLRFDSSEDEISRDKNELNIPNDTAIDGERIKILQDVTINADTNSRIDQVEDEVGIVSTGQNELFHSRCGSTGEINNPIGFPTETEDYFERLLQIKKEELLRKIDAIADD